MSRSHIRQQLDSLYLRYNRRGFVHPDPLEFLYNYPDQLDREIAGLVAASLAYGRVTQILNSVRKILDVLGDDPAGFIADRSINEFLDIFSGFRHRFTSGRDMSGLLYGIRLVMKEYGSLGTCFQIFFQKENGNIIHALDRFVKKIKDVGGIESAFLLPSPEKGSACKRLFLYLRWMVRTDDVDPGGWDMLPASSLLVPLDTHMYHIACGMGFTSRRQSDLKTAVEITEHFKIINPEDPVKYDFVLTRFGIRRELDRNDIIRLLPSAVNESE